MFPERPRPGDDDAGNSLKTDKVSKKTTSASEESWVSKNSGKIGISLFCIAIGLIYSYIASGQDRTAEEKKINEAASVEPYEINEIRFCNFVTPEEYSNIVKLCYSHFSHGSNGTEAHVSYRDFIEFVNRHLKAKIAAGHLLDRVVFSYILVQQSLKQNDEEAVKNRAIAMADCMNTPVSLSFLLVVLNMAVRSPSWERAQGLFDLATQIDAITNQSAPTMPSSSSASSSSSFSSPSSSPSSSSSIVEEEGRGGDAMFCSNAAAELVILQLCESWQIPVEKRVTETGVKYPIKTHRRKTPAEMIASYNANTNRGPEMDNFSKDEFVALIHSGNICAWAECYRS